MNQTDLEPFFDALRDIHRKNAGGCLFFAYVFWLWLKHNGYETESFQIEQYDGDEMQYIDQNVSWIENGVGHAEASQHFTWWYQGMEYDAEGEFYNDGWYTSKTLHGLNSPSGALVDEFCQNALAYGEWNESFQRCAARLALENRFGFEIPA